MAKVTLKSGGVQQQRVPFKSKKSSSKRPCASIKEFMCPEANIPECRINNRRAKSRPFCEEVLTSLSNTSLNTGYASMDGLSRFILFVEDLKKYALSQSITVADVISGIKGQSVLKHLYQHDDGLAVMLLERRLNVYEEEYGDVERIGLFDDENGTEEEQDITDMLEKVNCLKKKKDQVLFETLLNQLNEFEKDQKRVPYDDRCNLALLKSAGVTHDLNRIAMPAYMTGNIQNMLNFDDIAERTGWPWSSHSAIEITEAVKQVCLEEGAQYQSHRLDKEVKKLFHTGMLDLEHYSAEENVRRLCSTSVQSIWNMVDAYYCEKVRANPDEKNRLLEFKKESDKSAFITQLLSEDESLQIWVKGPLAHKLLKHQENTINKMLNERAKGMDVVLYRLTGFVRQAKAVDYTVNAAILNKLETLQIDEMNDYIQQAEKADDPLWLTGNTYSRSEIKRHLHRLNPSKASKQLRLLRDYLFVCKSVKSLEEEQVMLQAKNHLLKEQVEHLFNKARQIIDSPVELENKSKKQLFDNCLKNIVLLEELRPPVSVMDTALSLMDMVSAIGCSLIRIGEMLVSQRLRDISLEYQLKHHFDYDFKTEMGGQVSSIPGQLWQTLGAVVGQITGTVGLVYNTAMGNVCLVDACKKSIALQQGTTNALLDSVRQKLKDYGELCKHNPHMARILAGNIAQTMAVIENADGTNSELYAIFNQFKQRVSTEAMASYMAEQFEPADMDISSLNKEEAAALKRMFALCQLFQWAPEAVVGATGAVETARQAVSGSTLGTAWSAIKTVFRTSVTHFVKQGVSAMSDDEVRAVNTAIMTWRHGPREAGLRLQAMQTAAEFMADQAKGHSVSYSAVRAFFRPLTTRFSRLRKAYRNWLSGKNSCLSVISECLKITAVATPMVASAVATPIVATFLGPAFIGYTLTIGPFIALGFITFFYQMDPAEDMAMLMSDKLAFMLEPGLSDIARHAEKEVKFRLKAGGYAVIKRKIAYENLYQRFWPGFEEQHPSLAEEIEDEFEAKIEKDQQYHAKVQQLVALRNELMRLEPMLAGNVKSGNVISNVTDEMKDQVPADDAQAAYWVIARVQTIRETLFQALGKEFVPVDDEAVAMRLKQFLKRLRMVEKMRQHKPQVTKCLASEKSNAEPVIEAAVKGMHTQAYITCNRVAMRHSLMRMAGTEKISRDRLDRLAHCRQDYCQQMKSQLGMMKQIFAAQTAFLAK